jgi:hypothetical protein
MLKTEYIDNHTIVPATNLRVFYLYQAIKVCMFNNIIVG